MNYSKIFALSAINLAGITLGFFIRPDFVNDEKETSVQHEVPISEARSYFYNFINETNSNDVMTTAFTKQGYFDITRSTLVEISQTMDRRNFQKARVYFGSSNKNGISQTYFMLNGFDNSNLNRELNNEAISLVDIKTSSVDCPKFCDFTKTVLGGER